MPTIVTPDVENDLIARLVALAAAHFSVGGSLARNVFPGPVVDEGGEYPLDAWFVHLYSEDRELHYDGQGRYFRVQITRRFARDGWGPIKRAAAMTIMRAVYDAIHLSGGWTAGGGAVYLDIRAVDFPVELQPAYFSMNIHVWHRG